MPTIDHPENFSSSIPDEGSTSAQDLPLEDDTAGSHVQSEVAKRINLLGKLIIPPSVP